VKHLFTKAALPGWALIVVSQLRWLYSLVDAWSNVEFVGEKIRDVRLLAALASAYTSAWFQIGLICVGLGWIAITTSAWPRHLRRFWPRHPVGRGEVEDDVVYFVERSFADQLGDKHRERNAEAFALVQDDRGIRQYSRREIDALTPAQRDRLFAADPEMQAWWRGKSPRTGNWPLFRVRGGIWITKHQIDETQGSITWTSLTAYPGCLIGT
jgi:hypothetical protein